MINNNYSNPNVFIPNTVIDSSTDPSNYVTVTDSTFYPTATNIPYTPDGKFDFSNSGWETLPNELDSSFLSKAQAEYAFQCKALEEVPLSMYELLTFAARRFLGVKVPEGAEVFETHWRPAVQVLRQPSVYGNSQITQQIIGTPWNENAVWTVS